MLLLNTNGKTSLKIRERLGKVMMKKIQYLIILLLISCSNHTNKDLNKKEICSYVNDSIKICEVTINEITTDSVMFVNNMMHGERKCLDLKDSIEYIFNYHNGVREGASESHYFNGEKYEVGNYEAGKKEGKWVQWSRNGNLKKITYFNIDNNGEELFSVNYSKDSISVNGDGILDVVFDIDLDSIKIFVHIANPNDFYCKLMIGEVDSIENSKNILVYDSLKVPYVLNKRIYNSNNSIKFFYEIVDVYDSSYRFFQTYSPFLIDSLDKDLENYKKFHSSF